MSRQIYASRAEVDQAETEPTAGSAAELAAGTERSRFFEGLFEDYSASIVAYFKRQGFSADQSLELAQETFLRAWKGIEEFRAEASRSTWLFTIARNVLLNVWRDRQAKKREGVTLSFDHEQASGILDERTKSGANPESAVLSREKEQMLREELARLPQQMRQCLELRLGDLKYREIAATLDISIETVKSHLYQARQRLKTDLETYFTMDVDVEAR